MSLQQVNASDAIVGHVPAETKSFGDRLLTAQAIFFISLGMVATMAWIAFLGWVAYLAVLAVAAEAAAELES